jgi:hypothetical protein
MQYENSYIMKTNIKHMYHSNQLQMQIAMLPKPIANENIYVTQTNSWN